VLQIDESRRSRAHTARAWPARSSLHCSLPVAWPRLPISSPIPEN